LHGRRGCQELFAGRVVGFVGKTVTGFFEKTMERMLVFRRHQETGQDTGIGRGMVAIMKQADRPAARQYRKKPEQGTGAFRELEAVNPFVFAGWQAP
jgi:hypothetical protein